MLLAYLSLLGRTKLHSFEVASKSKIIIIIITIITIIIIVITIIHMTEMFYCKFYCFTKKGSKNFALPLPISQKKKYNQKEIENKLHCTRQSEQWSAN